MQWTDALATGVVEIDEQHQSLFQWLRELESATADRHTMTAAYAITRLSHYTRSHFAAEEALMQHNRYPELEAHRNEHEAFRKQLAELQSEAILRDVSAETIALLSTWLVKHISQTDMRYVPYLENGADK